MHLAARYNTNAECVRLLCEAMPRALIDARENNGNTPLHEAAYEGRRHSIEVLIEYGANLESPNGAERGGLTPLLAATLYGHLSCVHLLLAYGADTSVTPKSRIPGVDHASEAVNDANILSKSNKRPDGRPAFTKKKSTLRSLMIAKELTPAEMLTLPGHGALSVALRGGQLRVTAALLHKLVEKHGHAPPLFTRAQLTHVVLRLWAKEQHVTEILSQDETVHLFTILVLCARPHGSEPLSATEDLDDDLQTLHPPNPVLLSLQLASSCITEAPHFSRDSVVQERLLHAAGLLEHVASGLLYGAVSATREKEEVNKSFNPWRSGKNQVDPSVARDYFVQSCLSTAADYDLKVFVSNPFVSAHMLDVFWPTKPPAELPDPTPENGVEVTVPAFGEGGATSLKLPFGLRLPLCASLLIAYRSVMGGAFVVAEMACGVLVHLLALPLMLVIPRSLEHDAEELQRDAIRKRKLSDAFVVAWFFPAGRFALWFLSTASLAGLCTFMPVADPAVGFTLVDAVFFSYLLGWCLAELTELWGVDHLDAYWRDPFNVTDLLLIGAMLLTLVTRFDTCYSATYEDATLASPLAADGTARLLYTQSHEVGAGSVGGGFGWGSDGSSGAGGGRGLLGEGGAAYRTAPMQLGGSWISQSAFLPCQASTYTYVVYACMRRCLHTSHNPLAESMIARNPSVVKRHVRIHTCMRAHACISPSRCARRLRRCSRGSVFSKYSSSSPSEHIHTLHAHAYLLHHALHASIHT